jgi:hypothetical protein
METKEFNLVEILKDCPKGTPLYSPAFGNIRFDSIVDNRIVIYVTEHSTALIDSNGQLEWPHKHNGEMMIFPSKENRDWTTFKVPKKKIERFDPNTLKPYDKVLARDNRNFMWDATFFSHIDEGSRYPLRTVSSGYKQLIPFKGNEHLAGKCGEPDEYYRYWEDKDGQTAST